MSEIQQEAYDIVGPALGRVMVKAVTSTSANTEVTADAAIGADTSAGRMLRLQADPGGEDIYYGWYSTNALTLDETATSGNGRCGVIPAGQYVEERPPRINGVLYAFLYYKTAAGTGTLRVSVSSRDRAECYR